MYLIFQIRSVVRYIISMPAARPPAVGPVRNRPPLERLMNFPIITTIWNTAPTPIARNTMDATGDTTKPPIYVPAIAGASAMISSATRYEIFGLSFAIGATMADISNNFGLNKQILPMHRSVSLCNKC